MHDLDPNLDAASTSENPPAASGPQTAESPVSEQPASEQPASVQPTARRRRRAASRPAGPPEPSAVSSSAPAPASAAPEVATSPSGPAEAADGSGTAVAPDADTTDENTPEVPGATSAPASAASQTANASSEAAPQETRAAGARARKANSGTKGAAAPDTAAVPSAAAPDAAAPGAVAAAAAAADTAANAATDTAATDTAAARAVAADAAVSDAATTGAAATDTPAAPPKRTRSRRSPVRNPFAQPTLAEVLGTGAGRRADRIAATGEARQSDDSEQASGAGAAGETTGPATGAPDQPVEQTAAAPAGAVAGSGTDVTATTASAPADEPPADEPAADESSADESPADESLESSGADSDDGEDHEGDGEDHEGGSRRRRRRRGGRRRRRGSDGESDDDTDSSDQAADAEATDQSHGDEGEGERPSDDADSNGGTRRRRRRRRRGEDTSGAEDDPSEVVVKVREPRSRQSEITGIEGSTRVEAKRQRRREGRDAGRHRTPILSEAEFLARRESVKRTMVIRQRPEEDGGLTQLAVLEDGILVEHYVDAESAGKSLIGNVYLGRVQNVLPSMEAAFIDIGRGRNAVLYAGEVDWDSFGADGEGRRVENVLKSGQTILVQVTKDPIGAKGARLTHHVSLPGRYIVYSPAGQLSGISRKLPEGERARLKQILGELIEDSASVIVRTAAEGVSEDELVRDVTRLKAQWSDIEAKKGSTSAPQLLYGEPDLTVRIVRDLFTEDFAELLIDGNRSLTDAFDTVDAYVRHVAPHLADRLHRWTDRDSDVFAAYRIDEQIAKALERKVHLPSGGSLIIDRTEAMTVIDVNTGKFTGSAGNLEATVTSNNLEAAEEIVRQLRLRDIGGIIVVDFIDMVLPANRELLLRRLVECLGRDRTRHQVAEVTSLGLVQMTRKRLGTGLVEAFSTECEHCHGRGIALHDVPVAQPAPDEGRDAARRGRSRGGRSRSSDKPAVPKPTPPSGHIGVPHPPTAAAEPAHVEPAVDGAHVEPAVDAAHAEPAVDAAHVEPAVDAAHVGPAVDAAHVGPAVAAAHVEPAVDGAHVEPAVDAAAAESAGAGSDSAERTPTRSLVQPEEQGPADGASANGAERVDAGEEQPIAG